MSIEKTEFSLPASASTTHGEPVGDGVAQKNETAQDKKLRPKNLDEFIGQRGVREQMNIVLGSAQARGTTPDHILLSGPPGLGKTTLAMIVAHELDAQIRVTSGPALERASDLATILSGINPGDVLFIDEIHRMARPAEELLYMAMEDFRMDVMVDSKGPGATSISIDLAPFTLVGATTRSGMLTGPLRDRFGFKAQMEYYSTEELLSVVQRSAGVYGIHIVPEAAKEIASRSRGTPRIANRLLKRVRDYADVSGQSMLTVNLANEALQIFDVDYRGLDRLDRAVLEVLIKNHNGGPVGVSTLAASVGEEPRTLEEVVEPFLVREGMLNRTSRGRVATVKAWQHLGLVPPENTPGTEYEEE